MLNVAPNAVKVPENDFDTSLVKASLKTLYDAMNVAELKIVKSSISSHLDAVKASAVAYFKGADSEAADFGESLAHAEQVSLRLACLPDDDADRSVGLAAMKCLSTVFARGHRL